MRIQEKPRALIVEDSATAAATYGALLSDDFDVTIAQSRAQARDKIGIMDDLAVILCDYRLDDGLGTDVLRDIARTHPKAKATLITAHGSLALARETINNSLVHRFLEKGGSLSDVRDAVNDCLSHYEATARRTKTDAMVLDGAVTSMVEAAFIQEPRLRRMSSRLSGLVEVATRDMAPSVARDAKIASLVIYIGLLKVPFWITHRILNGTPIDADEWNAFRRYPRHTADMIRHFPKLASVASLIEVSRSSRKRVIEPNSSISECLRACTDAAWLMERLDADATATVLTTDSLESDHLARREALELVASVLRQPMSEGFGGTTVILKRCPSQLLPGDALKDDLLDSRGRLLLARGGKLSAKMIENLRTSSKLASGTQELLIVRSLAPRMPNLHTAPFDG